MNYLVIILAVILVLILWYVYINVNSAPTVASNIDLSKTTISIKGSDIKGGTSNTYAIGCWLYVKTMPTSAVDIFKYVVDTKIDSNDNTLFALNLSNSNGGPTLIANVATGTNKTNTAITLTTNMPVQSWVYVVVSVSSTYIDSYINGKLINSTPITGGSWQPRQYPSDNAQGPTFVSKSAPPIIITGLSRWNTPLDPQTIWGYYSQGNGNAMQSMLGAAYHLNVVFKKDSDIRDWSIF